MKIVIFSINPIFANVVTGGASKHLYHIAERLGANGHSVDVFSPKSKQQATPFDWVNNVRVFPVLPLHIPFPQPYAISGADLALVVDRLSRALEDADRFYIHDGELLVPDLYQAIPTTTSFRDNIYPESVLGSFIGKADEVISVSDYSADVIEYTAGRFYPGLKERLHRVNNGIDFDIFSPSDTSALAKRLGVNTNTDFVILHPHRPEQGKGLPQTIQVVERLVHKHEISNIKVLVPEWLGEMVSPGDSEFYNAMMRLMQDLGVRKYFKFIPWMPIGRMPELYSLGNVTLSLGNFVEAFGNVAYESLACGTPSIVARVGVHRSMLPNDLIDKVHYGDIDSVVDLILAIRDGRAFNHDKVLSTLKSMMDFDTQVDTYAEIITSCEKRDQLAFNLPGFKEDQSFILAPWCYLDDERIFHDFRGVFEQAGSLAQLIKGKKYVTHQQAAALGISEDDWETWIEKTWIVPAENG